MLRSKTPLTPLRGRKLTSDVGGSWTAEKARFFDAMAQTMNDAPDSVASPNLLALLKRDDVTAQELAQVAATQHPDVGVNMLRAMGVTDADSYEQAMINTTKAKLLRAGQTVIEAGGGNHMGLGAVPSLGPRPEGPLLQSKGSS